MAKRLLDRALTIIEILCLVVVGCLVMMVYLAQPSYYHQKVMRISCVNNLKQMGVAFRVWADDNGAYPMDLSTNHGGTKEFNATPDVYRVFQAMQDELGQSPKIVVCPTDTNRAASTNFIYFGNSNLSYFINVTLRNTNSPSQFLSGDRNLRDPWGPLRSVTEVTTNCGIGFGEGLHSEGSSGAGNILLNDGSAQQVTTGNLRKNWLPGTAPATFVIP